MQNKQKKRRDRSTLERCFALFLALLLGVLFLLAFAGGRKQEPVEWTTYTVRPGDKLWDIAQELEVQNWNQWLYETCEANDIEQGGMIYPGDTILIYRKVR